MDPFLTDASPYYKTSQIAKNPWLICDLGSAVEKVTRNYFNSINFSMNKPFIF